MTTTTLSMTPLAELAAELNLPNSCVIVGDLGSGSIRWGYFLGGTLRSSITIPHSNGIPILQSLAQFVGDSAPDLVVLVSSGCVENGQVTPTNGQMMQITEVGLSKAAHGASAVILNDAQGAAYHTLWLDWEGNVLPIWPSADAKPDSNGAKKHIVVGGGAGGCHKAAGSDLVEPEEPGHCQPQSNFHPDDGLVRAALLAAGYRPSCELAGAGAIGLSTAYAAFCKWYGYDPKLDYDPEFVPVIYRRAREGDRSALRAVAKQARELGGWLGLQTLFNPGAIVIDSDAVFAQLDLLMENGLFEAIEEAVGFGNSLKMAQRTPIGVITSHDEMGLPGGARYGLLHLAGKI